MKSIILKFNCVRAIIHANDEGMFDLNDIWLTFGLAEKQRPHQWRHSVRKHFEQSAKLRAGTIHDNAGHIVHQTLATQEVLYAYAMWCDVDFYTAVIEAFTKLANGEVEEAVEALTEVTSVHIGSNRMKCCKMASRQNATPKRIK